MEEINYVEYMPKEPPKAVLDYMEEVEAFSDKYIVYKKAKIKNPLTNKNEDMVRIKCAHCKGEMYVDIIKAECGRYATVPYGWLKAVKRIKYKEDKKLKKQFEERFEVLKELIFKDEDTGLEIIPCDTPKSLYQEGKILDHCVSSYSEAHAEGRSNIFFIRRIEEPEQPFFTLELKVIKGNMVVNQNRGYKNCDRTEIVIEFEKKWLEHIKKLEVNINGK